MRAVDMCPRRRRNYKASSNDWLDRYSEIRPHDALAHLPPARYREQLLEAESPV
jgi:transposase InsO family protein